MLEYWLVCDLFMVVDDDIGFFIFMCQKIRHPLCQYLYIILKVCVVRRTTINQINVGDQSTWWKHTASVMINEEPPELLNRQLSNLLSTEEVLEHALYYDVSECLCLYMHCRNCKNRRLWYMCTLHQRKRVWHARVCMLHTRVGVWILAIETENRIVHVFEIILSYGWFNSINDSYKRTKRATMEVINIDS